MLPYNRSHVGAWMTCVEHCIQLESTVTRYDCPFPVGCGPLEPAQCIITLLLVSTKLKVLWNGSQLIDAPLLEPTHLHIFVTSLQVTQHLSRIKSYSAPGELSITERELGFLRFATESVKLDIKVKELSIRETSQICEDKTLLDVFVYCLIIGAVRNGIGTIEVPNSWLQGHETRRCEFILLSTCVEHTASETCQRIFKDNPGFPDKSTSLGIKHTDGCEHQTHYHIMLIDWEEGPHCLVARRVGGGIAHIHRDN
jgi:hypothetical protein